MIAFVAFGFILRKLMLNLHKQLIKMYYHNRVYLIETNLHQITRILLQMTLWNDWSALPVN